MELYSWIVVVTTNEDHYNLLDYIFENKRDIYIGIDIVLDGALKRKDGKFIGKMMAKRLLLILT